MPSWDLRMILVANDIKLQAEKGCEFNFYERCARWKSLDSDINIKARLKCSHRECRQTPELQEHFRQRV